MRMLADKAKAEDVAQETWMRVIQAAADFQPRAKVSSWILTIAKNLCLNEIQKDSRWSHLEEGQEAELVDPVALVDEIIQQNWQAAQFKKALENLPAKQRVALVLSLNEDLSQAELAKELNTTVAAVKVLLFRAREGLEKSLRKKI